LDTSDIPFFGVGVWDKCATSPWLQRHRPVKDVEAYRLKWISKDVVQILDAEEIGNVHGVGHDWWA